MENQNFLKTKILKNPYWIIAAVLKQAHMLLVYNNQLFHKSMYLSFYNKFNTLKSKFFHLIVATSIINNVNHMQNASFQLLWFKLSAICSNCSAKTALNRTNLPLLKCYLKMFGHSSLSYYCRTKVSSILLQKNWAHFMPNKPISLSLC